VIGGRRVVVIVQARVGSTRLPAKVLMPLAGRPMVEHVLRRAAAITGVDEVVAAIPDRADDDLLAEAVMATGMRLVRGSADDVLARYAAAAASADAEIVVRVTADCPFLSRVVSGGVLAGYVKCDYVSNTLERTYPRGLDTEAFSREALDTAQREARDRVDREHVTPFIYRHPNRFIVRQVLADVDRSALRWTVDTPEDMEFARAVYDALGSTFEMGEVLELLARRPELGDLNRDSVQKQLH